MNGVLSFNYANIHAKFKKKKRLNIFILHRLRNKFLQLILISFDSASWELHQYSRRICGPMKNPKVEIRSRDSNSEPHDCKADALHHDHGHHTISMQYHDTSFLFYFFIYHRHFRTKTDIPRIFRT